MNKDLFQVLKATRDSLKGQLDPESQRYLDRMILERELDGEFSFILLKKGLNNFLTLVFCRFKP